MGLIAVTQTAELISQKRAELTEADKEFVVQFAFRTGDRKLTDKLIDELVQPDSDKLMVRRKFETMVDFQPDWIQKIENLLIALEMYRIKEEKAVGALSELLSACGIFMTEEELKSTGIEEMKAKVKRKVSL